MEKYKEIEKSIITTYRKDIWHLFMKAITDYKLISENGCMHKRRQRFLLNG